jgi:hypothetical protein
MNTADARRGLYDRLLTAVPAGQRDQAESWLSELLDLADDARPEMIRQAASGDGPPPDGERDFEVSCAMKVVTAPSALEAARLASAGWAAAADDRYADPDPNERYLVRPAGSRGPWQLIYPDLPESRQP